MVGPGQKGECPLEDVQISIPILPVEVFSSKACWILTSMSGFVLEVMDTITMADGSSDGFIYLCHTLIIFLG